MASKFSVTDVQDDSAPTGQKEEDVSEGELHSVTSVKSTTPLLRLIYSCRLLSSPRSRFPQSGH